MVDSLTREKRSWNMSRIRSMDTNPEKIVRSLLHRMGYRFRLHVKNLPGKPDIVLPKYKTAIFVHGCFWHRHPKCKYAYTPKSRIEFWGKKFSDNVERFKIVKKELKHLQWNVLVIWECAAKQKYDENLCGSITSFLLNKKKFLMIGTSRKGNLVKSYSRTND